jgi:UDP-glucose:(heptosyl)LPS alpha-1,3-glucosyltransferase
MASSDTRVTRPETSSCGPIKVAVLTEKCGMAGGCERFVHETSSRIAAMPGFAIDVFANRWEQTDPRIRYHRVPMIRFPKFIKPWAFVRIAQRMICRGGYDVVHAHLRNDFANITTVHPAPHRFWVREVLGRRTLSLHDRMMIAMERRMVACGSGRAFLPVSQMLLEVWREEYGELPGEWGVQSPGVDTERFAPDPAARASLRHDLGIGGEDFVLLFVGMNFEVKGLQQCIGAIARFLQRCPSHRPHLVVVGKGDQVMYSALAASLGIKDRVHFVGVEKSRLPAYCAASDIAVMLSSFETYCIAVHEAMSAGLPAIVTRRMGVADMVECARAGIVVESPFDESGIDRAVDMLSRPGQRTESAQRARACAISRSWDSVARETANAYRMTAASTHSACR